MSPADTGPHLPPDLYRHITEFLSESPNLAKPLTTDTARALCALAHDQTSHALQFEAERVLYHDLVFLHHESCPRGLIDILRSRTAAYVERIFIIDEGIDIERSRVDLGEYISYTDLPYDRMNRLRVLELKLSRFSRAPHALIERSLFGVLADTLPWDVLREFSSFISLPAEDF
ncbi:hypothetical protein SISSUDRAFT_1062254 [Sistotremastrum suecicum HHB10207 ss-3]|uniref:F-box domain-containing protein n=1 Tax=Sistotremastrum suecicum HHB10207 ss-3 TaxID=1314776 RepID=A0A166D4S9_9AGAM|nr:hypothetical protein SISSUDRAFT_1062254 [Sistotremastrum suecicum HHB10207 ss-3]